MEERTLETESAPRAVGVARASVTLRDVAQASGVSITTVSRILNGRESGVPIREDTRERVIRTAAELGYRPNLLARGLRGQASTLLGVIARDIADPFHIQILQGINAASVQRGYRMFLGNVDYHAEEALAFGSMFERSHADGIILIGDIQGGESAADEIAHQHGHVVGVTDRTGPRAFPGVYTDSEAGTLLALEHLWDLGHRAIMCVSDARTADGRSRIDVYERFMREHDLADRIEVQVTDQETALAFDLGSRLFARPLDAIETTAIYATSDTTAIGLMQAAFRAGIAIPDRLSIVGFDDIDVAAFMIPPLTTVSQDGVRMGREAVELLFGMIDGSRSATLVEDVVIRPSLVVRRSTASVTAVA
jgi:DNA-binding LacI/PurR family transcriptional regulator